jgi:hypothetical protein
MAVSNRKRLLVGTAAVAFIGLLLVALVSPFETTVVPEWKIHVVDESGKPVGNLSINEGWIDYYIESSRHEEVRRANSEGYVEFPRRTVRASLLARIRGVLVSFMHPHAPSGTYAFANVMGPYVSPTDTDYEPGKPLPQTIVVGPQP